MRERVMKQSVKQIMKKATKKPMKQPVKRVMTQAMRIAKRRVLLRVNREEHEILIYPHQTLADVLRDELHLTGTKQSCSEGACGTCTVLLDGIPVRSCLLLAVDVEGKEITTIEGLAQQGRLHPVQEAFVEHYAIQCGFCTPGMILTAKALLDKNPHPTEEEIRTAISGNICRCTGYAKIVEAIKAASEMAR
jgi:aerobic carbon-monoxide dehydrogenase small subunit